MSKRAVNIATISEEDVLGEEIGENGMVEMVSAGRLSGERTDADGEVDCWGAKDNEGREQLERPDSLVEKEDNDAAEFSSSILSAISSLDGIVPRPAAVVARSSSSSSIYSTGSIRSPSPARSQPPTASPSSPKLRRRVTWRGGRVAGSTLNLSGKFVTELTICDPSSGPINNSCISLGLFIATDQTMGDHSVYKMSPVSPLAALKIQQQDRLLKVNDISVMGWSHSCLVEFFRNLTLTPVNKEASKDNVFEMPLAMEFRKTGKIVRSAEESPSSKRVAATVRIRNQRATLVSVHDSIVRVRHSFSYNALIRLKGDLKSGIPLYLKITTSSSNIVTLNVGERSSQDDAVCFRLHLFDVSPPRREQGEVVVIETPAGNGYLYACAPGSIAVMQGLISPPSTLLQTDVRFFYLAIVPGSSSVRIKNIHTGEYLSANTERVALEAADNAVPISPNTLFEVIRI